MANKRERQLANPSEWVAAGLQALDHLVQTVRSEILFALLTGGRDLADGKRAVMEVRDSKAWAAESGDALATIVLKVQADAIGVAAAICRDAAYPGTQGVVIEQCLEAATRIEALIEASPRRSEESKLQ